MKNRQSNLKITPLVEPVLLFPAGQDEQIKMQMDFYKTAFSFCNVNYFRVKTEYSARKDVEWDLMSSSGFDLIEEEKMLRAKMLHLNRHN